MSCLDDLPRYTFYHTPLEEPGTIYNRDQQCTMYFGETYSNGAARPYRGCGEVSSFSTIRELLPHMVKF